MTLLLNEIHYSAGLEQSVIVCAADFNLTKGGKLVDTKPKLFEAELAKGMKIVVSYFGLASWGNTHAVKPPVIYLADEVEEVLKSAELKECSSVSDFVSRFHNSIGTKYPAGVLKSMPSGFHIAGYNAENLPEFWFFANAQWNIRNSRYEQIVDRFSEPVEHFLNRDALQRGYRRGDASLTANGSTFYKNGDLRTHMNIWDKLVEIVDIIADIEGFKAPSPSDRVNYEAFIRLQYKVIGGLYKQMGNSDVIGTEIKVVTLSPINKTQDVDQKLAAVNQLQRFPGNILSQGASAQTYYSKLALRQVTYSSTFTKKQE